MKRILALALIFAVLIGLTSCAIPKSSKALIREAAAEHGECTVVSIEKADGGYSVVLHDELQDFDYTVKSYKAQFEADGSKFGSYASTKDTFVDCLMDKVMSEVGGELDKICKETGTRYLNDRSKSIYLLPVIVAEDEASGKKAAEAFAKVFSEHNLNGRMDGWPLVVYWDSDKIKTGEHRPTYWKTMGTVKLPSTEFVPKKEKQG